MIMKRAPRAIVWRPLLQRNKRPQKSLTEKARLGCKSRITLRCSDACSCQQPIRTRKKAWPRFVYLNFREMQFDMTPIKFLTYDADDSIAVQDPKPYPTQFLSELYRNNSMQDPNQCKRKRYKRKKDQLTMIRFVYDVSQKHSQRKKGNVKNALNWIKNITKLYGKVINKQTIPSIP